jgi:hypothetical protein
LKTTSAVYEQIAVEQIVIEQIGRRTKKPDSG